MSDVLNAIMELYADAEKQLLQQAGGDIDPYLVAEINMYLEIIKEIHPTSIRPDDIENYWGDKSILNPLCHSVQFSIGQNGN